MTRIFKRLEDERKDRSDNDVDIDMADTSAAASDAALATGRLADPRPLTEDELGDLAITMDDFSSALDRVQPSAQREGFTTTPNVTWEDVGSLTEIREELRFSIAEPIAHPERFEAMGLNISTGVLLYGPPGCGKTLVAKATANEAMANFISIKGPELMNKYVGESERAVRTSSNAREARVRACYSSTRWIRCVAKRKQRRQYLRRACGESITHRDGRFRGAKRNLF